MNIQSDEVKSSLQKRLRRIEGQVRGVQKMLEDERDCREILQQLNAAHAAIERATAEFVREHARECLLDPETTDRAQRAEMIDELLSLMARVR